MAPETSPQTSPQPQPHCTWHKIDLFSIVTESGPSRPPSAEMSIKTALISESQLTLTCPKAVALKPVTVDLLSLYISSSATSSRASHAHVAGPRSHPPSMPNLWNPRENHRATSTKSDLLAVFLRLVLDRQLVRFFNFHDGLSGGH
ncbi:hypothetical protein L596_030398 [Steinernema carpocapsae]|uniref:Uncharacterized protein n=1 Tax=Steinernema carpocapsae TaxID=34508 RepID=A0A4U5LP95_STECR|nr:hypothetical protein L596_030398 [Steinernema carpocapsae]